MNYPWSDTLVELTRNTLRSLPVTPDGYLHLKNTDDSFAKISLGDLMTGTLKLIDKKSGEEHQYRSADELIAAGWVVD